MEALIAVIAAISPLTAYLGARSGASVERDKLALTRAQFRATRRDLALDGFKALSRQMEIVLNDDVDLHTRQDSAQEAHRSLLEVAMILGGDGLGGSDLNELLQALQDTQLDRIPALWLDVRDAITTSKLE